MSPSSPAGSSAPLSSTSPPARSAAAIAVSGAAPDPAVAAVGEADSGASSWSTPCIDNPIRFSCQSMRRIRQLETCPGLNISVSDSASARSISEMWHRPSTPGASSTKTPKSVMFVTVPVTTSPTPWLLAYSSHSLGKSSFIDREMRWP